ncbi:pollen receptor-like kinase 3, partial [Tanacetum coccineum]
GLIAIHKAILGKKHAISWITVDFENSIVLYFVECRTSINSNDKVLLLYNVDITSWTMIEMKKLAKLRHKTILTPLAYHFRKEEKLLVSEYIARGSLERQPAIRERGNSHAELTWPNRLKIIKGVARGRGLLHSEFASYPLHHGNLKSSNVLIGSDYEPLLKSSVEKDLFQASEHVEKQKHGHVELGYLSTSNGRLIHARLCDMCRTSSNYVKKVCQRAGTNMTVETKSVFSELKLNVLMMMIAGKRYCGDSVAKVYGA